MTETQKQARRIAVCGMLLALMLVLALWKASCRSQPAFRASSWA